ncbi:MAG: hypothetical protein ABJ308_03530 [Halieaceae bacterium]
MEDYGLGLALFDYIPVALSALGLYLLAGLLSQVLPTARPLMLAAVALVAAGGLSKASWKLVWALSHSNIELLSHLLFILMAPGMLIMACHVGSASYRWAGGNAPVKPALWAALLIAPIMAGSLVLGMTQEGRAWFFLLLAAASVANISMSTLLIRLSWRLRDRVTALIFLFSILIILSLSGLSRISAGSAPLQWLAECLNTLAHGSFALAVWRLRRVIPSTNATV